MKYTSDINKNDSVLSSNNVTILIKSNSVDTIKDIKPLFIGFKNGLLSDKAILAVNPFIDSINITEESGPPYIYNSAFGNYALEYKNKTVVAALRDSNQCMLRGIPKWGALEISSGATSITPIENVNKIYSTEGAVAFLKKDKTVEVRRYTCGGNTNNGTDDGYTTSDYSSIPTLSSIKRIYSNQKAFAALTDDNKLWTWGSNEHGGNTYNTTALENVTNVYATKNAFAALLKYK